MKTCPVCKARCFDDMEICFGCLHRFSQDDARFKDAPREEPLQRGALEGLDEPDEPLSGSLAKEATANPLVSVLSRELAPRIEVTSGGVRLVIDIHAEPLREQGGRQGARQEPGAPQAKLAANKGSGGGRSRRKGARRSGAANGGAGARDGCDAGKKRTS